MFRVVADVWEKDVWEFQAKSGSSGSCGLFFGKSQYKKCLETRGSPRHPRPSECWRRKIPSELRKIIQPGRVNLGKSKWGLSNGCLKATLCNLHTIVYNCALLGPFWALSRGNFRRKMTTIGGNRGQLWTSTLSPHLRSPQLDFPNESIVFCNCLWLVHQGSCPARTSVVGG